MPFDPVPWFIEGGAMHSAEVARMLANVATGNQEGCLNTFDLRVLALATPGTNVRVMPGACVINNRALASEDQSYMGRSPIEDDTIAIPASGSSGPRTHLVIARVENPYISGEPWAAPPDAANGPYIFARVIPDVPITVRSVHELGLGYSAITLARITVPANTATVTQSMITDLRSLVNTITGPAGPQGPPGPPGEGEDCPEVVEKTFFDVKTATTEDKLDVSPSSTWRNWPSAADWLIPVPPWATGADVYLTLGGIRQSGGTWGALRVQFDNSIETVPVVYDLTSDYEITGWTRHTLIAASTISIPSSKRNKVKRFRCQARVDGREPNNSGSNIRWMAGSVAIMQVVFKQNPIMG